MNRQNVEEGEQAENENDSSMSCQESSASNSAESDLSEGEETSTKNPADTQTYDQDFEFLTGKSSYPLSLFSPPPVFAANPFTGNMRFQYTTCQKKR